MSISHIKNCEDEQLHLIESVQSFGYLLAVELFAIEGRRSRLALLKDIALWLARQRLERICNKREVNTEK